MDTFSGNMHVLALTVIFALLGNAICDECQLHGNLPEQIHLSWTGDPTSMFVTWATPFPSNITTVRYGQARSALSTSVYGLATVFTDGGPAKKQRFIHRAMFHDLTPAARYYYQCQSDAGWSKMYSFRSIPTRTDWIPRLLVFGDLGDVNAQSLAQMTLEVQQDRYDLAVHLGKKTVCTIHAQPDVPVALLFLVGNLVFSNFIGDFAYDMDTQNGDVGDDFFRKLEPLAAIIPYMVVVGNHDKKYNFSHYKNRFTTPGDSEGMFYSFTIGPLHIAVISTEFYLFPQYGVGQIFQQYEWLLDDLINASADGDIGWMFLVGHRPMYCSNQDSTDCNPPRNMIRGGIPSLQIPGVEDLMYHAGVDVGIWAHVHSYERTWPLYNLDKLNGSCDDPYMDPRGIVHLVSGAAGNKENQTKFATDQPGFSAFRTLDYGYTRVTIFNLTHVHFEQVSDDQNYTVVDSIWLRKSQPGRPIWHRKNSDYNAAAVLAQVKVDFNQLKKFIWPDISELAENVTSYLHENHFY